jgi:hypothetical protein
MGTFLCRERCILPDEAGRRWTSYSAGDVMIVVDDARLNDNRTSLTCVDETGTVGVFSSWSLRVYYEVRL